MPILGSASSATSSSFAASGFESIATINGSGVQSVTFSSIPQNYTDLLVLITAATASGNYTEGYPSIRFNGDSGSNYSRLNLNFCQAENSQGSAAGQDTASAGATYATNNPRSIPTQFYVHDYSSTDKYKSTDSTCFRLFSSFTASSEHLGYLWASTAAVTSITLVANTANGWANYAKFSLYGIGKK